MGYVSLRNARIVADRLYVPSAGSVSVCVTGALGIVISDEKIFFMFVLYKPMYKCEPRAGPCLAPGI